MSASRLEAGPVLPAEHTSAPALNRMITALLALGGLFVAVYLLLFELRVVGTLVCGVGGGCHTVQASQWAVFLGVPVPA